jgi:hypothetical protein
LNPLSSHEKILRKFSKTDFSDSLNRTVYAPPPLAAPGFRSPRSLRSFPRLTPAHFASPGHRFAVPLSGLAKCHIQPERYAQFNFKYLTKDIDTFILNKQFYGGNYGKAKDWCF